MLPKRIPYTPGVVLEYLISPMMGLNPSQPPTEIATDQITTGTLTCGVRFKTLVGNPPYGSTANLGTGEGYI